MRDIYIIGAGGMGREVEAVIAAINAREPRWRVAGFVDDDPSAQSRQFVAELGHRIVGGVNDLAALGAGHYALAIGHGRTRRSVLARLDGTGLRPATLIHPDATIGRLISPGVGTIICAGVRTSTNISFGRHTIIGAGVIVGHDCVFGDFCTVMAGAVIAGGVTLGAETMIGSSATVLQYLRVGAAARVGAGSVVVRDVAEQCTVKGLPAR